ncbi:MAG TPA: alpha/beta hydrolase [Chroococcidiopsis sp.]
MAIVLLFETLRERTGFANARPGNAFVLDSAPPPARFAHRWKALARSAQRVGLIGFSWALGIGLVGTSQAIAAEQIVLKYRALSNSVSVQELTDLAENGTVSPALRAHFRLSGQDPNETRELLNRQITANPHLLDRVLNSTPGNFVLDQVGEAIYTPSRRSSRQAMRSTIVLSADDDNRISLIELMQNYPTREVHVDVEKLADAYNQLAGLQRGLDGILGTFGL